MKYALFLAFVFLHCIFTLLQSYEGEYYANAISLGHTEGKGLGYSQGYTSLDLFLAQPTCSYQFVPFLDLRGHIFNNGKCAANAGLGLRWYNLDYAHIWGINGYYDSFLTSQRPYHQAALGLEFLSDLWEVHINGYLPVGRKNTPIYRLTYEFVPGFLAKAREQFAMKGFDVEVGYHFCNIPYIEVYTSLGPYFYWGKSQKTENAFRAKRKEIVGGRVRAFIDFLTYLRFEGIGTYDSRFKWGGQATLCVNVPFNWMCENSMNTCFSTLEQRLYQPVVRNEIILINRIHRFSDNPEILDPTHEP